MTIVAKRSPQPAFSQLRNEVDSLFDSFFRGFPERLAAPEQAWVPPVAVSETDTLVKVRAELPGLTNKDIDISLDGDILTISGEKHEEKIEDKEKYVHVEHSHGRFLRRVRLPSAVDAERAEAKLSEGVLQLRLPKSQQDHVKTITVQ